MRTREMTVLLKDCERAVLFVQHYCSGTCSSYKIVIILQHGQNIF